MSRPPYITVNWDNLHHEQVGAGLEPGFLSNYNNLLEQVHASLHSRVASGELPFLALHEDTASIQAMMAYAQTVHTSGDFDDCVVLGIGGSSLGASALIDALGSPKLRMHFCDNMDPEKLDDIHTGLDWNRTIFVAITKSGNTIETIAQTLSVRRRLQDLFPPHEVRRRLIAITDPENGFLRDLATKEEWTTFPVPPGVGGRYSVFTAVGLLPAALAGVDIERLVQGIAWGVSAMETADPTQNTPLSIAAALTHLATHDQRAVVATVPYRNRLEGCGHWFAQLWAESLGKAGQGSTPVTAVGSTTQHSQLQLWMEGPSNTIVQFIDVEQFPRDITVDASEFPQWEWIDGHSFGHILRTQLQATRQALSDAGRPNLTWVFPAVTPESVGAWMIWMEAITAYAGGMMQINPFDQPGVEATKVFTRQMLTEGVS